MDYPFCPGCTESSPRPRRRMPLWLPAALIVAVLGSAVLAASLAPSDTRDFKARHGYALKSQAL